MKHIFFSLCVLCVLCGSRSFGSEAPRPNIIVILADDMGYADAGFMGSEVHTPNLDRIAHDGVLFTQFYNTSRCCPTRASLMTGLYPHQSGMGHMTWTDWGLPGYTADLSHDTPTIAEVLKPAGYSTYMAGKWHLTRNDTADKPKDNWPRQRGFDRFYGTIKGSGSYYNPAMLCSENQVVTPETDPDYHPEHFYYTDAIADHAIRYITDHNKQHATSNTPFFMYVAFTSPHWPLHAMEEDVARYKGKYDAGYDAIREARLEAQRKLGLADSRWELSPQPEPFDAQKNKAWEARCMEVYAAQIDRMDQNVGRIVDTLKSTGQLDNTLIVFLQDNGACAESVGRTGPARKGAKGGPDAMPGPRGVFESYGRNWANVSNTPFREYKHFVHEGGISTPLVAYWPGHITRHAVVTTPAHLIDLMPTFVSLAGATFPAKFNQGHATTPLPGVDLTPAFDGKALVRRQPLFWEHEGNRAERDGKWKIVATGPKAAWELYDIDADRSEMHDLAGRYPDRVKAMADAWQKWAEATQVLPMTPWEGKGKKVMAAE